MTLDVSNSNATYEWSNGTTSSNIEVVSTGTYAVTVTKTDTFCIADDEIRVSYLPLPQADLGPDTSLCLGQEMTVSPNFLLADYEWQDGSTGLEYIIKEAGLYEVTVTNQCGTIKDAFFVDFEDCSQLYVPNAFSPNRDGINDYFLLQDDGDVGEILLLRIFDRWGGLVFEAENFQPNAPEFAWDGTYKNKPLNAGIFTFFVQVLFRDGSEEVMVGDISLLP